ncbi:Lrp/AsnC family transcriptional regulator [Candidatus Woesearchaeota archaeon]|nr:Lrp/AsnC family transcriptional regulator [Candidatus Woesearchaeota archaeon]
MDKLDWKILSVLDQNGRMPASKIARLVGSSKEVVSYRMKRLEKEIMITRYYPIIDLHKLGYHTTRLYFDLEEIDTLFEEQFLHFLDKDINAGLIFRMDYPYRYGILLWVKSIYELEDIVIKIKKKCGKVLLSYTHAFFCNYKLYPKDYLFSKKFHQQEWCIKPISALSYDTDDFSIITELANDARQSTISIAKKLHLPQTTVSNKIKALEKKQIIMGYRAEINFIKLGYINYFLEIYLSENHNRSQIEHWADANKNVVWLQKVIGACDLEIEVEVKDRTELESLLNELRTTFKNIRKIVFWSQEYKKFTFVPSQTNLL